MNYAFFYAELFPKNISDAAHRLLRRCYRLCQPFANFIGSSECSYMIPQSFWWTFVSFGNVMCPTFTCGFNFILHELTRHHSSFSVHLRSASSSCNSNFLVSRRSPYACLRSPIACFISLFHHLHGFLFPMQHFFFLCLCYFLLRNVYHFLILPGCCGKRLHFLVYVFCTLRHLIFIHFQKFFIQFQKLVRILFWYCSQISRLNVYDRYPRCLFHVHL